MVLGQGFRDRRIEWRYLRFDKIQDGCWRPSRIYKNGHNFATGLPIDVMFGSSIRFSESADLMVQLSMTLSDPEPQFQGHSIVQMWISRKRCMRSTPCLVLGKGFRGRQIEWCYFWFDSIQDGGWRPSWNDCAVAVAPNPCVSWAFLFRDAAKRKWVRLRISSVLDIRNLSAARTLCVGRHRNTVAALAPDSSKFLMSDRPLPSRLRGGWNPSSDSDPDDSASSW